MDEETKQKLEKFTDFLDKVSVHDSLPVFEELQQINESLKTIAKKETPIMEMPEVQKVEIEGAEIITIKGDKGDSPTDEDLINLIKPLIPEPIVGPEGKMGQKGDKPIAGVDYPIPKDGKDGESIVGPQGERGKDGSPDTAQETRDKLESLLDGEKLSIQAIQDLPKVLDDLMVKLSANGTNRGTSPIARFIDDETPSGTINGSNTVFTISKSPKSGSLKVYRGGARQRVTEDYTLSDSDKTITFTVAPEVGEILLCDFRY